MLGIAIDALPGALLSRLVFEGDAPLLEAVLARARIESTGTEIIFKRDGGNFSARVEADTPFEDARVTCLVVTDLSEQRRHEAVIRAEALGRSILDQAVDAVVVCDPRGDVVRASNSAHLLCGCNPLLQPFDARFPAGRSRASARSANCPARRSHAQRSLRNAHFRTGAFRCWSAPDL